MPKYRALPVRLGMYWKWACKSEHVCNVQKSSGMVGFLMRPILKDFEKVLKTLKELEERVVRQVIVLKA